MLGANANVGTTMTYVLLATIEGKPTPIQLASLSVEFKGCDTVSINLPTTHTSPTTLPYTIGSAYEEF